MADNALASPKVRSGWWAYGVTRYSTLSAKAHYFRGVASTPVCERHLTSTEEYRPRRYQSCKVCQRWLRLRGLPLPEDA